MAVPSRRQTDSTRTRTPATSSEPHTIGKSVKMYSRKCAQSWRASGGERAISDAPDLTLGAEISVNFVEKSKAYFSFAQKEGPP